MTAEEKASLRFYENYIVTTLNPVYILSNMREWLPDEVIERIQAEEKNGTTAAAGMFLNMILELEDKGWFRGFLDALVAAGYTGLAEAIENWDFQKLEQLEMHRRLLKRIEATMLEIKARDIIPLINPCLINRECEEILQLVENRGQSAGAAKLVECLCRSDKENWPKEFQLALHRLGYDHACKLWDMKEGSDKEKDVEMKDDQDEERSAFDITVTYSEAGEVDNFSGNQCSPPEVSEDPVYVPKKARSYQLELARPAINGKNTLICAPTGSGKTFVALLIAENHLENMPPGQKGKIAFLATKIPVYEQQRNVFKQHFETKRCKVGGICGETVGDIPGEMLIEQNDIIVLTPQILVNWLQYGTISSLAIFTLLIFDECHNTTGNHPYNVLMSSYLDLKFDSSASPRPQIVGLTASIGVGSATDLMGIMEYICMQCACLDIQVISTIRENREDLEKIVFAPKKIVRQVKLRPQNRFVDIISSMISKTEALAKQMYPIDTLSPIKTKDFGTQTYEQWIVTVQKKCRVLQLEDKEEESRICHALFTYTEHLRKYNDALIINEDARTQDALAYLIEFFKNIKSREFDEREQQLTANFEEKLQELTELSTDESNVNPKLQELSFILDEEYHQNPQTRTLLFVKTKALVVALKKWVDENPALSHLKPEVLMGHNRNQNIGMTLLHQKGALDSFRSNGKSKMLIATSVADEGIDVAECNLVLLYEYTGNVIKMIQVRGRGRAKGSKCILVTSKSEVAEKETVNIWKEEQMNKAIKEIQKWSEEQFLEKVKDLQNKEKIMRDTRKRELKPKMPKSTKRLLCGKCKVFACNTDDIRVIEDSQHIVIDKQFSNRFRTHPHSKKKRFGHFEKKCKMYCKVLSCQHDWGITVRYKTFDNLPVIKVESFVVEDIATGEQSVFRKWVHVDFELKKFDVEEMSC
ncbi:PREDICTED: probable ATP-dependent RNA helicase DDX58 isoform X2 [Crocodylus porosus]|uniref:RNA helicase n=1 Tax=Crocodylus porosus TaxID=8502 RepID=A0A7M4G0V7_CROPO|nr:PREDICTED: probable ATP-dependent RNA helicase DDX58 isoform X2 [Crocodylus porosus]